MSWYIATPLMQIGPVSASDIAHYLSTGKIGATTKIFTPGMGKWEELTTLEDRIKQNISSADTRVDFESAPRKFFSSAPGATQVGQYGSANSCIFIGIACLIIGFLNLLDPTTASALSVSLTSNVANLHKLAIGSTFSIIGAIFLAVGIRPR